MQMQGFLLDASAAGEAGSTLGMLGTLAPMILIIVLMYFLMIRPQKKREKETQEMRSKLDVGDEVVTRGGVIGRVVSLRDDTLIIETGSDRSKIRVARWAVEVNNTVHDDKAE